jgi:5-methylcytosine-specific restriction endonuclease McrA
MAAVNLIGSYNYALVALSVLIAMCQRVLQRDGWRCQACGARVNLEVHHKQHRSQAGDDSELNLVTLCAACHANVHREPAQ